MRQSLLPWRFVTRSPSGVVVVFGPGFGIGVGGRSARTSGGRLRKNWRFMMWRCVFVWSSSPKSVSRSSFLLMKSTHNASDVVNMDVSPVSLAATAA
eukprot:2882096-Ditylum_brightwellii.AAC.1